MSRRAWAIYIGLSLGLWLLAQRSLCPVVALALLVSILVHELGHWAAWRLAGERAVIFASPYLGACIPVGDCGMDIFTPLGKGMLLLAGCGFSQNEMSPLAQTKTISADGIRDCRSG